MADLDLVAFLEQLRCKDPEPVEHGAVGGAEVFEIPQAMNSLETGVLARSEVVVDSETAVTADGEVAIEGMTLVSDLDDQGLTGPRLRDRAAGLSGDGGRGCLPSLLLLLGEVFPRREICGKGGTVGVIGSLRDAFNGSGHLSIVSRRPLTVQGPAQR